MIRFIGFATTLLLLLAARPAASQPFQRFTDLPGLAGDMAWADLDGDGDQDVALAGDVYLTSGSRQVPVRTSRLYLHEGDFFIELAPQLIDLDQAGLAWGDYDRDGDPDLVLAGADGVTSASCVTRLYRNDAGQFTDTGATLTGVRHAALKWGDYDADGWPDLALAGLGSDGSPLTRIYHNDHGALGDSGALPPGLNDGSLDWADADGDHDLDLLLAGNILSSTPGSLVTKIYRHASGSFSEWEVNLPGGTRADWVDIDHNGTPEVALFKATTSDSSISLYRKSGDSYTVTAVLSVYSGPYAWADVNHDGYPDLHWTGQKLQNAMPPYMTVGSGLYINNGTGSGSFTAASAPITLASGRLEWINLNGDALPDPIGMGEVSIPDQQAHKVQCVMKIQTDEGYDNLRKALFGAEYPGNAYWHDLNGDQYPELFTFGSYWGSPGVGMDTRGSTSVYLNQAGDLRSIEHLLQACKTAELAWADMDGDGDEDLVLNGMDSYRTVTIPHFRAFRNDAGTLAPIPTDLPHGPQLHAALADFTHDGRPDLAISDSKTIKIYRQDTITSYTALDAGLPQAHCQLAAADYDQDGWPDLAVVNDQTTLATSTAIYRNNHGQFEQAAIALANFSRGKPEWVDIDMDGDPDLVIYGSEQGALAIKFYRNDGGGAFTGMGGLNPRGSGILGTAWGDYDGDGDRDLGLWGYDYELESPYGYVRVLNNNGWTFEGADIGLRDAGALAWGDYDKDGDLDLVAGQRLYRNQRTAGPPMNAARHWGAWN